VEVLQAIHLLLAFPLFVVVVAVDARWMKRSLKNQFSLMLAGDGSTNGATDESADGKHDTSDDKPREKPREKDEPRDGRATPDDYLEKIFQVPFWIRPLGSTACKNLVRELTKDDVEPSTPAATNVGNLMNQAPDLPDAPVRSANAIANAGKSSVVSNTGSEADAVQTTPDPATTSTPKPTGGVTFDWSPVEPKPRTLQVSETERDYMVSLATVIGRSPRSVKRFVNCYRLLKSSMDPADLARSTRDGSFRTTMLLLGIVSGLPEIAPELLTDLRAAPKETAPDEWARGAAERLALDARGKWGGVLAALQSLPSQGISSIAPLATVAGHV